MNAKQIWQTAIERLQTRVTPAAFTTWFQGTSALSFQDGVFIVCVPTTFAKAHLENRFIEPIRSILTEITGDTVDIQFMVAKDTFDSSESQSLPQSRRPYRPGKGRPSAAQREKRIADVAAAAAMNSLGITTPYTSARRGGENTTPPISASQEAYPATYNASQEQQSEASVYIGRANNTPHVTLPLPEGLLNPRYTFDAFIVGKSNQLAYATSKAVSENPGHVYNPLFLYAGVGLGKTHMLHALGHAGEASGLNVLYVTSEKFTNEIINAIRYQKTEEFRAKYRQIDILLVDDIQFIAGKESTEEEFFHTFNFLHNANKQIVVTSDRPPKAIHSLQDRLRSRFEWGLLVDVQPPEYEHRMAILRSKCDSLHFVVPSSVTEYIARPECSNVRELEGALNRVIAYAMLHSAPLSVAIAAKALEHLYAETKSARTSTLSTAEVLDGVCRYYNVARERLVGNSRGREIAWPRQVAMYLMRQETSATFLQIGTELGGRDHSTIKHGWEKVQAEVTKNDRIRHEISSVLEAIQKPLKKM
ncbi:MAG: chromosomal replication initiator protein DnaA [Ktedonobacteraceae bacterium]